MQEAELCHAVAVGRTTASELGVAVEDAVVLSNSDRIVVRLTPGDVLARIAPLGHADGARYEVEIAAAVAAAGGPVGALAPGLPPQVHPRDGFVVSLWTYYPPTADAVAPAAFADALRGYHRALRQVDLAAPHAAGRLTAALRVVRARRQSPELPDPDRALLDELLDASIPVLRAGHAQFPDRERWRAEGLARLKKAPTSTLPGSGHCDPGPDHAPGRRLR